MTVDIGYGVTPGHSGHGSGHGTVSVCPVCLKRVAAKRVRQGNDVLLVKHCPDHGAFQTILWRGDVPRFGDWVRPKSPSRPLHCHTGIGQGCPFDCGLCPDHGQHTCTALLEVTQRCDLCCPVCFADAGPSAPQDPDLETIGFWYRQVFMAGGRCNIQLSGGEPTMREDLEDIIRMGQEHGFDFIQLNTNGLRLGKEPGYARRLRRAGLKSVFLQFDGVDDHVYRCLRGTELWAEKQMAVQHCAGAGLGVVLVATLVPGVNDHAIGDIVRFGLSAGAHVRGVHFQPISYFGRFPTPPGDHERMTLPDVMRGLEAQTGGMIRVTDFQPPGCEHALCSFHGNFLRTGEGGLRAHSREGGKTCCASQGPKPAAEGAVRSIDYTARQWALPGSCACIPKQWPEAASDPTPSLEQLLDHLRTWTFSVSAMAFQDCWNLDLERLKGCCIHVVAPDGRLVPFCAYNLTSADGRPLYRKAAPDRRRG